MSHTPQAGRPDAPDSAAPARPRADTSHANPVAPGLHLIATPIGAARDITLRALDLLAGAEVLAAEDTRSLRRLMEIHGLSPRGRPVLAYHDHNGPKMRPKLLEALSRGASVLYAAEAGTPLVADPGFQLVRAAINAGYPVHAAPGASAVLAALAVSGLPSDRFCFLGFPPQQQGARRSMLAEVADIPATLIFYESPKRISRLLEDLCDIVDGSRAAVLCRELTKRHEEVLRMPLADLAAALSQRALRGEVVLLLDRGQKSGATAESLDAALVAAMERMTLKAAVAEVAEAQGLPRRAVYQAALRLRGDQ